MCLFHKKKGATHKILMCSEAYLSHQNQWKQIIHLSTHSSHCNGFYITLVSKQQQNLIVVCFSLLLFWKKAKRVFLQLKKLAILFMSLGNPAQLLTVCSQNI